jgi:ABC-2 type transport system permease protein
MPESLIHILAFFTKELNEAYRQPRLIVGLILGPLIILLLFGMGYRSGQPQLLTILVIPEELQAQVPLDDIRRAIEANFELVAIVSDEDAAMQRLYADEVDVVEILPRNVQEQLLSGNRSSVEFRFNEINPFTEQWIRYLAYAQVSEINRSLLLQATRYAQQEARTTHQLLRDASTNLEELESGISAAQRANLEDILRQLREGLDFLVTTPLLLERTSSDAAEVREQIQTLRADLVIIEEALDENTLDEQQARIIATQSRIAELERLVERWSELPPQVIISPLQHTYINLRGSSLDYTSFYAPGVLALILQHIAIMLASLSLVRERMLGALELYRVAPVSMLQILIGKYASYTTIIATIALILLGVLIGGLGVPLLGSVVELTVLLLLFILATLGIGFLISAVSQSDSQAVQLSMLILLSSIFFSGVLLSMEYFTDTFRTIAYILPLTHCIEGLQEIMLKGRSPRLFTWGSLAGVAALSFVAVALIAQWQFRRAS